MAFLVHAHLNWGTPMFAELGVFGFRVFLQIPFRARIHLWNSQLDVRPDFCACKTEAWGRGVMIQTRLHCLYILGWLLPSPGFFLVNTKKDILLHEEESESQQLIENSEQELIGRQFYGLQVFALLPPSLTPLLAWLQMRCLFFKSGK